MTDSLPRTSPELSVADVVELERLCDQFESSFRDGTPSKIEDVLADTHQPLRSELLKQLILIECEYREPQEFQFDFSEYQKRFPDQLSTIERAKSEWNQLDRNHLFNTVGIPETDFVANDPNVPWIGTELPSTDRYEIRHPIGQGGSAIVYRAHDTLLGRDLAIKTLRPDQSVNNDLTRRFLAEAKIASQLQHPGVGAVYDQGCLADGRPFLAMKLIEGTTLAAILTERSHRDDQVRLLGIFEQVCRTLGYAHTRGIVHRDLKPANIMVGEFGEVQVMDWGLAKVLSATESTSLKSNSSPVEIKDLRYSQDGMILGTLGYMPPEQARGESSSIDARADVFSLGAILFEILTGEAPLARGSLNVRLQMSRTDNSETIREKLNASRAEQPIIELASQCLSYAAEKRPQDGSMVANQVSGFLSSLQTRLDQQRLQQEKDLVRQETESRRRRLAIGLAVSVLCLTLVSSVAGIYWNGQQARVRREKIQAESDIDRAEHLVIRGDVLAANEALKEAAVRLSEREFPELQNRYDGLASQVEFVQTLRRIQEQRKTPNNLGWFDNERAITDFQEAFHRAGYDINHGNLQEMANQVRSSLVDDSILSAIDNWALVCVYRMKFAKSGQARYQRQRDRLLTLARLVDPHPELRDKLRNPAFWTDPDRLERLSKDISTEELSPRLAGFLGELLRFAEKDYEPLLRRFQAAYPDDFWLNINLARAYLPNQLDEAIRFFQAAIAVDPRNFSIWGRIGTIYLIKNDWEQSEFYFLKSLEINPHYVPTLKNLAGIYSRKGQKHSVIDQLEGVVKVDPDDSMAHFMIGQLWEELGDWDKAIVAFENAVLHSKEFSPPGAIFFDGEEVTKQELIAHAHYKISRIHLDKGEMDLALNQMKKAIQLDSEFAMAQLFLGRIYMNTGQFQKAIEQFRLIEDAGWKFVNLAQPVSRWHEQTIRMKTRHIEWTPDLPDKLDSTNPSKVLDLARLHHQAGNRQESVRLFQEALSKPTSEFDFRDGDRYAAATDALELIKSETSREESENRTQLLQLALHWLNDDLNEAGDAAQIDEGNRLFVKRMLHKWQNTQFTEIVRLPEQMKLLPAQTREGWSHFWGKVGALERSLENKTSSE